MASKRYQIWDETSIVITPSGEVFTAEQWMNRYPMAMLPEIKLVIAGGTINGAFCGEFSSMVDTYEKMGCDFSACVEDQDFLDAIEAYEDAMNNPVDDGTISNEELTATSLASIAASLEYQNMLTLEDVPLEDEASTEEV